jgi:ketosteroid isomerase-like protein
MKTTLTAIALAIALVGPAVAADDAMSIAKQLSQNYVQATNKGDAANLTSLYAKNAILLPQGIAEPVVGEANIRKFFDVYVAGPKLGKFTMTVAEATMIDSKTMFVAGTWGGEVPGQNGGASTHIGGTWLTVDVLEGRAWKIRAATRNLLPAPFNADDPSNALTIGEVIYCEPLAHSVSSWCHENQPATAASPSPNASGSTDRPKELRARDFDTRPALFK